MMLGREIDLPVDLIYPAPPSEPKPSSEEYVLDLQNKMKKGTWHCKGIPFRSRTKTTIRS